MSMNLQELNTNGFYLEAEVAPAIRATFEDRYRKATGSQVTLGNPPSYQGQTNKWGAELRVYFSKDSARDFFTSNGLHVEANRSGYKSDEYSYRINNNEVWWSLVEELGLRLGSN
ncbi:MAG: hypothetical protein WCZ18_01675 [Ottowia sp.]|nr:hypothetical protein [Ottowia sp.]